MTLRIIAGNFKYGGAAELESKALRVWFFFLIVRWKLSGASDWH